MRLASAITGPFKSIDKPQTVALAPDVTVLVGMNEAGKTVFLQSLSKCRDILGLGTFNPLDDYPRKDLPAYLRLHDTQPAVVARLTWVLDAAEVAAANERFGLSLPPGFGFDVEHFYDNDHAVHIVVDERPVVAAVLADAGLSTDGTAAAARASSLRGLRDALRGAKLSYTDHEFFTTLDARVERSLLPSVAGFELWEWLEPRIPRFLYFSEYELLPSKVNLRDLAARQQQAAADPAALTPEHRGVLALLRMADIDVADFARPASYELLRAKIEGVSITLTDQIMEFWKQNEDLEVQIDIAPDSNDEPPFNEGPNLYLRIKSRRHRGISTPFKQRSRGFIWFFSFLVWFDSVQQQIAASPTQDVVLLLDEPGLSLHALAQRDLLHYIDSLSTRHQVIYTTHSPFLIDPRRLAQVRTVEDLPRKGTTIGDTVTASDPRTLFPLQVAQATAPGTSFLPDGRCLLVARVSDLVLLSLMSSLLDHSSRLDDALAIVPAGGAAGLASLAATGYATRQPVAVLQSRATATTAWPLAAGPAVVNPATIIQTDGASPPAIDLEDLIDPAVYVAAFNRAHASALQGRSADAATLPAGSGIVDQLETWLAGSSASAAVTARGLDRLAVARQLVMEPGDSFDAASLDRFAALCAVVRRALPLP